MLNIALFGPQEKEHTEYLIKKFKLFYIATGDILRKTLGLQAKSIIQGGLVSDLSFHRKNNPFESDVNGFLFEYFRSGIHP